MRKSEQYFDYIKSDTYKIAYPLIALSYYLSFHTAAPSHEYYVQLRSQCKNKS